MTPDDPNEAELKRIHGDDVELAPDDSVDDKLTESQALEQAKADGIEFVDEWVIVELANLTTTLKDDDGLELKFDNEAAANQALADLDESDKYLVSQRRRQK